MKRFCPFVVALEFFPELLLRLALVHGWRFPEVCIGFTETSKTIAMTRAAGIWGGDQGCKHGLTKPGTIIRSSSGKPNRRK